MRFLSALVSGAMLLTPVMAAAADDMTKEELMMMKAEVMMQALATEPDAQITRLEFVTMVMDAFFPTMAVSACLEHQDANPLPPRSYSLLFADVTTGDSGAVQLCRAMQAGIVHGYPDGYFRPERSINLAEAAKVLSRVFALSNIGEYTSEFNRDVWYASYVHMLADRKAIPLNVNHVSQALTRSDVADMIDRLQHDDMSKASRTYGQVTR